MSPNYMLAGASAIQPLRQGKLSSLCGLYSILNGLQLSLFPRRLSKPELQRIYRHAIEHLSRRRQLKRVLGVGMDTWLWIELRDELIAYINAAYDMSLKPTSTLHGSAATDRGRMIAKVKRDVRAGSPVLAGFGGALDHYSVICGYTATRLILFDSSGLFWIKSDNLGLGEWSRRHHWISSDGMSTIIDNW